MATRKVRIQEKTGASSTDLLHPETEAGVVTYSNTSSGLTATNVQDAIDEVLTSAGAVDDVQNGSGVSLVSNKIATVTPSAIGAEAAFTDGSATIASESNNVVTIKAGVSQSGGAIGNSSANDIVLGTAAKKDATTSVTQNSTDLVTSGAVWTAIDNMPEPMVFKGSLGTGGTITSLPTASSSNEGFVYKVITAGTYASQSADIGDTFISTGSEWVLIPSGDEPSGTVTNVAGAGASGSHIQVTGGPITSSGTLTVGVESGYSIPSDTNQTKWSGKRDTDIVEIEQFFVDNPSFKYNNSPMYLSDLIGKYLTDTDVQYYMAALNSKYGNLTSSSSNLIPYSSSKWAILQTAVYVGDTGYRLYYVFNDQYAVYHLDAEVGVAISEQYDGLLDRPVVYLKNGITGTFSATWFENGVAKTGYQSLEYGSKSGTNTPSNNLVTGGLFFEEI